MALFRRKTTTTEIPELQEYYAAKRANNSVGAWVMAFVSLIATVLIILGLFYGGRWVWRKIQGNDNKVTTTVENAGDDLSAGLGDTLDGDSGSTNESAVDEEGSHTHENGEEHSAHSEGQGTGTTGTSSTSTTTPSSSDAPAASTPTAGGSESSTTITAESLPNSGPGDIVALFAISTTAGYAIHRYRTIKKQS